MIDARTTQRIVRSFGMANQLLLSDLKRIEAKYSLDDLVVETAVSETDSMYLQFDADLRAEAITMAENYRLFYCLERSIRQFISEILEARYGARWWDETDVVKDDIKADVKKNMRREVDAGITPRSDQPIDFTTFGQLSEIIKTNWDEFGAVFSSIRAVERVLGTLNTLRNPIAHCSRLAEDEIRRLELSLRDWFRLLSG